MSSEFTAAIYGGLAGGVVGGALGICGILLGLFAERYLQRRGKLRCILEGWELTFLASDNMGETVSVESTTATSARYSFSAKFFNEKDVDTGLRDLSVEFYWKDGRRTVVQPCDSSKTRVHGTMTRSERVEVLNLPSREWLSLSLHGSIGGEDARNMRECKRVLLTGYFPTDKAFKESVPFPETAMKSWFSRVSGR